MPRFVGKRINLTPHTETGGYKRGEHLEVSHGIGFKERFFRMFDEGVTEKMAREIFLEYVRRQGLTDKKALKKISVVWEKKNGGAYNDAVFFVDALIEKLSQTQGIDKMTMWHGLINGKIRGEELYRGEVRKLFDDIFGPNFMEELSKVSTDYGLQVLMKKYLQ